MWSNPSPFFFVFIILSFSYGSYAFYQMWSSPQKWLNKWVPDRKFYREKMDGNRIRQWKIMAVIGEVVLITTFIIVWFIIKNL